MKLLSLPLKTAFAINLALLNFTPVQGQPINPVMLGQTPTFNSSRQFDQPLVFNAPPPPNDINAPSNRTAGGKRGCETMDKQLTPKRKLLTALVPVYGPPNSELVLGATTASHPTFWFYVPYTAPLPGEFALQNEAGQIIYQTSVSVSATPGVVSVSLPSTASPLEVGKRYHWYFNIYCQPQQPPVFVDGWIRRVELNPVLTSQLEKATPKERIALFASKGIWYEALTGAAELSRTDPSRTDWAALLQAAGLGNLASEPTIECCKLGSGY